MKVTLGRLSSLLANLWFCVAIISSGQAAASVQDNFKRLNGGEDPASVAADYTEAELKDLRGLEELRLMLRDAGKAATAEVFLEALSERDNGDAVLLNLSLSCVDQMPGKNLMQQGFLSTRSQRIVTTIIERDPSHWTAWYIRGLNNLYWPDYFRKAPKAREYLQEAVALHQTLTPETQAASDRYALGYLALGDAYALLDEPAEARRVWNEGRKFYPYVEVLQQRLAIADEQLHSEVRALRDADKPIDTGLYFLRRNLNHPFELILTGGTLFGPGPLEDQPLAPGGLVNLNLGPFLAGFIPPFNNGAKEPNLPGEILQGKLVDGLLADGAPANENVDVGFVQLMNGRFNLFLAAVQDGPHQGKIDFFLDRNLNWTIFDDIGIDPGFPVGVIKIRDFVFSTSPRVLPMSRQTESGAPAGVDRAGSLQSGAVVTGALGDEDFDGRLDGIFNAIGRFPYDSMILPGAPFAQTRVFRTDIPVTADQAMLLTLSNALGHLQLSLDLAEQQPEAATELREIFKKRIDSARRHAEHSDREEAVHVLNWLSPEAGKTELCAAWAWLKKAASDVGLSRREFDGSGVNYSCS